MPHTPDTHLIITPKHAYINGELISPMEDTLELTAPSPTRVQTVTLTITPTTVTIIDDDDPDTINAAHEAVTRTTRDKTNSTAQKTYLVDCTREALDKWKLLEATYAQHTKHT